MTVVNKLVGAYQNMGLCAPVICYDQLAENKFSAHVQTALNKAFQNAANSTFSPFVGLRFYDPVASLPQFDWTNYIVIALILILVIVGIMGSLIGKITQSDSTGVRVLKCFSIYDNITKILTIQAHN
jgi:hypothetical protein